MKVFVVKTAWSGETDFNFDSVWSSALKAKKRAVQIQSTEPLEARVFECVVDGMEPESKAWESCSLSASGEAAATDAINSVKRELGLRIETRIPVYFKVWDSDRKTPEMIAIHITGERDVK